jgi:hypothetical protein
MGELGLKPKSKRVGDRKANKRVQQYEATYANLYVTFQKKNLIDDAENIDEPEGYQPENNTITLPTEILPAEEPSTDKEPSPEESVKIESPAEEAKLRVSDSCSKSSAPITKKVPPPIPPKPAKLQVKKEPIPEPIPEPETTIYKEEDIEEMYDNAKCSWERFGNDPDDFTWECFIEEIDNLPQNIKFEDSWHRSLHLLVQFRRGRLNRGGQYSDTPTNQEIASRISKYLEKRGQVVIVPPQGCRMVSIEPQRSIYINQKECERAYNDDYESDDDDDVDYADDIVAELK